MTVWDDHFDAIYASLGVTAKLSPADDSGEVEVTVVDASLRFDNELGSVSVPTVSPRVCVRVTELAKYSITRDILRKGTLTMGGQTWRIDNTAPRPGPVPGSGEVMLVLVEAA